MKPQLIKILGIDPGSYHLGVGCIEKFGHQLRHVNSFVLSAPKNLPLYARLERIYDQLLEKLQLVTPDQVAIEAVFCGKNAKSAYHLGMARGVVVAACFGKGLQLFEYAPTQIKLSVAGHGRADKDQVKKMTELCLQTKVAGRHDATDALAVAICHATTLRPGMGSVR